MPRGGPRPNSGSPRPNSGEATANSGGATANSGGARANSGGARQNSGGPRPNSGGPRRNAGGRRAGAGRSRRLPTDEPDQECLHETGDNISAMLQGPMAEDAQDTGSSSSATSERRDTTVMRPAARGLPVLYAVYYVWDSEAEEARRSPSRSEIPDFATPPPQGRRCSNCGGASHTLRSCQLKFWSLRISNCRFCGTIVLGKEVDGVCCGKKKPSSFSISFKRRHPNSELRRIYGTRGFQSHSSHLNSLFATTLTFIDLSYANVGGLSFLRLQGNASIAVPNKDARYSFLCSSGPPSLRSQDYTSSYIRRILSNENIRYLVPKLYEHLKPRPQVRREVFQSLLWIPIGAEDPQAT